MCSCNNRKWTASQIPLLGGARGGSFMKLNMYKYMLFFFVFLRTFFPEKTAAQPNSSGTIKVSKPKAECKGFHPSILHIMTGDSVFKEALKKAKKLEFINICGGDTLTEPIYYFELVIGTDKQGREITLVCGDGGQITPRMQKYFKKLNPGDRLIFIRILSSRPNKVTTAHVGGQRLKLTIRYPIS
jgi:hypothetical protein